MREAIGEEGLSTTMTYGHRSLAIWFHLPVTGARQPGEEREPLLLPGLSAIVRSYGRKDGQRRTLRPLPYPSLAEAWPLIWAIFRRQLRHDYKLVEPKEIVTSVG
jgi:hypothetical protein